MSSEQDPPNPYKKLPIAINDYTLPNGDPVFNIETVLGCMTHRIQPRANSLDMVGQGVSAKERDREFQQSLRSRCSH